MSPLLLFACTTSPPPAPAPAPIGAAAPETPPPPYWKKRSELELDETLRQACTDASAAGKPLLLEFSAPWCGDCKRMRTLKMQAPLSNELEYWERVIVDVGRFDRHPALIQAFGVGSIAYWVALEPDCSKPVIRWKRLAASVFEPASTKDGVRTAVGLTSWLVDARQPLAGVSP